MDEKEVKRKYGKDVRIGNFADLEFKSAVEHTRQDLDEMSAMHNLLNRIYAANNGNEIPNCKRCKFYDVGNFYNCQCNKCFSIGEDGSVTLFKLYEPKES